MSTQFIACTADECPLNEDRQCRAPWIAVDEDGRCMILDTGPYDDKSPTEKYVELKGCKCSDCNHYEIDKETLRGDCGLGEDLFFKMLEVKDDHDPKRGQRDGPFCHAYDKQISKTPAFQTDV